MTVKSLSRARLFVTPWTVAPSPGDLSDPGIEPPSPTL